jgi:predicted acyl esterase
MSLVSTLRAGLLATVAVAAFGAIAHAQTAPMAPDIAGKYVAAKINYDYEKRVVMIPMRDGTKLYTVIVIPKGGKSLPILLTRTPYNAAKRAARNDSSKMVSTLARATRCSWPTAAISASSRTSAASTVRRATT